MYAIRAGTMRGGLALSVGGLGVWTGVAAAQDVTNSVGRVRESMLVSQSATGVVFRDTNGDGVLQPGEPGTPNVLMTNGLDVVKTDEVDYIRDDFVAQVIGADAVFGKTHGDIMFDDLSLFTRYNAVIGQVGIPC